MNPTPTSPPHPGDLPEKRKSTSWKNIVGLLLLAGLVFFLLDALPPIIPRHKPAADRTEALNNIRQVHLALVEFDNEFGKFPDAGTVDAVKAKHPTELDLGAGSSNQIFRQLIASGLKSEKPFWCKTPWSPKKPDNIYLPGKALEPGEVGFAYIAGLSIKDDPSTPLLVAPLIPGTTQFDPKPYGGKAIILRLDGSATPMQIRADNGVVMAPGGKDLFDPAQPFWKDKTPDIKWPETK